MAARLISIVGPPAVGKTTLAEALAAKLKAGLIREQYASNPFLAASYIGADASRLASQLYFLLSRVAQLSCSAWPGRGLYVSDYGFCQDPIYARLRLSDADFRSYEAVLKRLAGAVHPPDVLIHLDAAEATLLERIARRGRGYESAMTAEFLAAMRAAYDRAVAEMACPVLRIDCDGEDLLDAGRQAELIEKLRGALT